MKVISASKIFDALTALIQQSLVNVESQACQIMGNLNEPHPPANWALSQILENNEWAAKTGSPACQDTGLAVFFVEYGQNIHIPDGYIEDIINGSVRKAYKDGYHRKSVAHPLTRQNTLDNTPAIIHTRIMPGDSLKVSFLAKGAGSENMSALYMLTPSKGRQGIIDSVTDCVRRAGSNPCPPIIVGVGVGGDTEQACLIAKSALLRPTGTPSSDPQAAALEQDILAAVNALNIGIQGFGGANTALAVAVNTCPTHIGMLPVAVNIQCHSVRHGTVIF